MERSGKGLPPSTQDHFDKLVLKNYRAHPKTRRLECQACRTGDARLSKEQFFFCIGCQKTSPRVDFKAKDLDNFHQNKKKTLTCQACLCK